MATGATILKESSPQATVASGDITVAGPFLRASDVQFTYCRLPCSTGSLTIEQRMPVGVSQGHRAGAEAGNMQVDDDLARPCSVLARLRMLGYPAQSPRLHGRPTGVGETASQQNETLTGNKNPNF